MSLRGGQLVNELVGLGEGGHYSKTERRDVFIVSGTNQCKHHDIDRVQQFECIRISSCRHTRIVNVSTFT